MSHLELVALVVRGYDAAIRFFVDVLQFELVEDTPSLTMMAAQSDGLWFVPAEARQVFCSRVLTARTKRAAWAGSSPVESECSCASKISILTTSVWSPPACSSSRRLAISHTADSQCFWILRGTAGISWGETRGDRRQSAATGYSLRSVRIWRLIVTILSEAIYEVVSRALAGGFMFHRRILAGVAAGAMCVATSVSVTWQGQSLAITRVNIVDVVDGQIISNSTVVIRGRTITAVSRGSAPPHGAQVVDGLGKFLMPGLWDMHAHVQGSGEAWLQLYAANGVTGIRDMGADLEFILSMRDATSSGRILGPEVIAAGPILDDPPADWPLRMRVRNADEGRAAVQLLKRRGVDFIKVHNFTPRDAFFAIADEARRQNLSLAGHVPLKVTVEEGIEAGMVSIEHFSENGTVWRACSGGAQYRPEACRPFFEVLARRRVWQTPTLVSLSEVAVIGTPASTLKPEHVAYANKALRDMWAEKPELLFEEP